MLDKQSQGKPAVTSIEQTSLLATQAPNKLSEKSKKLLQDLELSEKDIVFDEKKIEILNAITNTSFFGHYVVHTFLNKSLWKSLLLSLTTSRKNIIQNGSHQIQQPAPQTANIATSRVASRRSSQSSHSSSSDDSSHLLVPLSSSSSSSEEITEPEIEGSSLSMLYEKMFYLSSPVLIQNEKALKKVVALSDFYETVIFIFESTWNIFFISLLANGMLNLVLYSDQLRTINERIDYLLSIPNAATNTINGALSRPWFYGPLIGLPLVWGTLNGIKTYSSTYSHDDFVQELEEVLEDKYSPGVINDTLGWLLTSFLPEWLSLFSPLNFCNVATPAWLEYILCGCFMCGCLPSYRLEEIIEEAKHAIVWDGKLTKEERLALFEKVFDFKEKAALLTYAYYLSTLNAFVKEIDISKLNYLKKNHVDSNTLHVLLKIKAMAFEELYSLARQYDSDNTQNTTAKSFLSFLYANHLLWSAGHPQKWFSYILSPTYHALRYSSIALFYYSFFLALYPIAKCKLEGKKWDYFEEIGNYICHVCGNFPIPFTEVSTIQKCLNAFLEIPRPLEELEKFIDSFDLTEVESLNISNQVEVLLNETQLAALLKKIKPKLSNLKFFKILMPGALKANGSHTKEVIDFIKNIPITNFTFQIHFDINRGQEFYFLDTISKIFKNKNILYLNLHFSDDNHNLNLNNFVEGLKTSSITDLSLFISTGTVNNENMIIFSEALPKTKLLSLSLNIQVLNEERSVVFCSSFARNIARSKIRDLSFYLPFDKEFTLCAANFFSALRFIDRNLRLQLDIPEFDEISGGYLADLISQGKLTSLDLRSKADNNSVFNITNRIFKAIANSTLEEFKWNLVPTETGEQLSKIDSLVDTLVNSISYSNIKVLKLSHFFLWHFSTQPRSSVLLFAKYLSQELSGLTVLDLESNGLIPSEIQAISASLEKTSLKTLILSNNRISYGANDLGKVLPKTSISTLELMGSDNIFTGNDTLLLFENIASSNLKVLKIQNSFLLGLDYYISEAALNTLFLQLPKSSLEVLILQDVGITNNNAFFLSQQLVSNISRLPLWPNFLENRKIRMNKKSNSNLRVLGGQENLYINNPHIWQKTGIEALCKIMPYTNIEYSEFIQLVGSSSILSFDEYMKCGLLPINEYSGGSRLSVPLIGKIPYKFFMSIKNSAYNFYFMLNSKTDIALGNFFKVSKTNIDEQENNVEDNEGSCKMLPNMELTIDEEQQEETNLTDNFSTSLSETPPITNWRYFNFFNQQSELFLPESTHRVSPRYIPMDAAPVLPESNGFGNSNNHHSTTQACLGMALMPGIGTMILSLLALYLIYRAVSPLINSTRGNRGRFFSSEGNADLSRQALENKELRQPKIILEIDMDDNYKI